MSSDVETILNEIRERVRAEERTAATLPADVTQPKPSPNGLMEPAVARNENLERVAADLSVTARAWDRLPPVVSNRSGALARAELWIKNSFKGLTRWFTWEQVNFNAAVHHALKDILTVVAAEREHAAARDQKLEALEREVHSLRSLLEKQAPELERLRAAQVKDRTEVQTRLTETKAALARVNDMLNGLAQQSAETANTLRAEQRLTETSLAQQIAETANELRDEQRVLFKQLSLEVSEAAILEDRGRRALDARVEKLEQRNSG
ncbi:MAG TPA: hypothetical protein VFX97_07325 [Pyrinomonadaceae bacterium]|nr:hypothetical protein [Pyrinomonadaceae bacterium]